jgi:hypothetical protein
MRRYAGITVLCGLFVIPALLFARAPAPRQRTDPRLDASAAVAERLLVKEYGADAEGVKGAKLFVSFLVTQPDDESENGKNRYLFAVAAGEVSYSGEGLVTFKDARFVLHMSRSKHLTYKSASLRFRFAGPVRRLQDIHKAQLKNFEFPGGERPFDNAHVELIVKRKTD